MNILYFVHGFTPSIGAGAINAHQITKYLGNYGHKILVLSPGVFSKTSPNSNLNDLSNLDIQVKYSSKLMKIPLNLIFSHIENMVKYLVKLKSFSPDIILSQYSAYHFASVVGGYVAKILKIPHVIRSHDIFLPIDAFSLPFKIFHSALYTRIYRSISNCNTFYVTATEMKRHYLKFKKLQKINFQIHHNGIDTNSFYPFNKQEELKDKYGCENVILFVGQIGRDFDLQYILKILPKILKEHKDTHFLIVGGGPQSVEEKLRNLIKNYNLTKQIHILGIKPHNEIPFYINNCTIGVGRITHERIWRYMVPVKCLEYMACAKPFITAPISEDVIKNNDVGLQLRREFTPKEIIDNLNNLIEDKNLSKKLGENGLKKIKENFLWEEIMKNFNNELLQIINKI